MYQAFVTLVKETLQQELGENYVLTIQNVVKVNDTHRCGITIQKKGVNISPTIYLEEYYQQYQSGEVIEDIVECIISRYNDTEVTSDFDVKGILNFSSIKEKIMFKLINLEKNDEFLQNVPYVPFYDFAIVFYVFVDMHEIGSATITVKNNLLEIWNITKEELYDIAKENTSEKLPFHFLSMSVILEELSGKWCGENHMMYVLTNSKRCLGASCILYEGTLEHIRETLEEDFYLIPSSIHEWIVIPLSCFGCEDEMNDIISEINETQVEEEEILGNRCYYYDSATKELR